MHAGKSAGFVCFKLSLMSWVNCQQFIHSFSSFQVEKLHIGITHVHKLNELEMSKININLLVDPTQFLYNVLFTIQLNYTLQYKRLLLFN